MAQLPFQQPNLEQKDLHPGDHIYTWRIGYHHHGIYEGNGKVIHWRGAKSSDKSHVVRTSLEEFRTGNGKKEYEKNGIKRVRYGVSKLDQTLKLTGGTCHTEKCDSVQLTLKRARNALKRVNRHEYNGNNYQLLFRNCESFAVYCKLGYEQTLQGEYVIEKVLDVIVPTIMPGFLPSKDVVTNVVKNVTKETNNKSSQKTSANNNSDKKKKKHKNKTSKNKKRQK